MAAAPRAGVVTARELFGSESACSGGAPAKRQHSTAHLEDPVTSRDLFGTVRGRCQQVRAAQRVAARGRARTCLFSFSPPKRSDVRRGAV